MINTDFVKLREGFDYLMDYVVNNYKTYDNNNQELNKETLAFISKIVMTVVVRLNLTKEIQKELMSMKYQNKFEFAARECNHNCNSCEIFNECLKNNK